MPHRKRARAEAEPEEGSTSTQQQLPSAPASTVILGPRPNPGSQPSLLSLPKDVLQDVLSYLDCRSLVRMQSVCSVFVDKCRVFKGKPGLSVLSVSASQLQQDSMVEKAAQAAQLRKYNGLTREATRWQHTWLMRMRIDETLSPFDMERCERAGFTFAHDQHSEEVKVRLEGMGPKMLVSQQTTRSADFLHWHLELRGNNAVELGVIPEDMQESQKTLHKCMANEANERPTGVSSSITVGSLLPVRVPLMKGSNIELLLQGNKLEVLVTQPEGGYEMTWINSNTVPRRYVGPKHFKFEIECDYHGPAKLAITCWAHAEFVLMRSGVPRAPIAGIAPAVGDVLDGQMLQPALPGAVLQLDEQNQGPLAVLALPQHAQQQQQQGGGDGPPGGGMFGAGLAGMMDMAAQGVGPHDMDMGEDGMNPDMLAVEVEEDEDAAQQQQHEQQQQQQEQQQLVLQQQLLHFQQPAQAGGAGPGVVVGAAGQGAAAMGHLGTGQGGQLPQGAPAV